MKITIKGTNITLSDSVYQYIETKIGSVEKFAQGIGEDFQKGNPPIECWVEVEKTTDHHRNGDIFRAEAQMKLPGVQGVRAEAQSWDIHQAIDFVKDNLQRQLKRYKRKQITRAKLPRPDKH